MCLEILFSEQCRFYSDEKVMEGPTWSIPRDFQAMTKGKEVKRSVDRDQTLNP